ncbi:MAG: NADH-quinone oxidoreductase subunit NuoE [Deltaproteobacteria bacterium]|nr:NADH-quinone oxidoreductase subunit NuoE [Deltaproteobacteria bacterium]
MSLLNEAARKEILECTKRYPEKRAALLPALHVLQRDHGWIPQEGMKEVAELLGLKPAEVLEVVTFYTMFNQKQVGRHHIQVCRNISCALRGARRITRHISGKLGIQTGETTPDGQFTLSEVECLGSCGTAPMLMLNDDYHENLTEPRVDEILDDLS